MTPRRAVGALLVALSLGVVVQAQAFTLFYTKSPKSGGTAPLRWPAGAVDMTINTFYFPSGGAEYDEIVRAVDAWDAANIPGSSFGTTTGEYFESGFGHANNSNGLNEITFSEQLGPCNTASGEQVVTAAVDYHRGRPDRAKLIEADLELNAFCYFDVNVDYFDYNDDPAEDHEVFSIEDVVLHEMGHVAGLGHEDGDEEEGYIMHAEPALGGGMEIGGSPFVSYIGWPRTMATTKDGGSAIGESRMFDRRYDVNEDDRQGLRALYPTNSNPGADFAVQSYTVPDISVSDAEGDCVEARTLARPEPHVDVSPCPIDPTTGPLTPTRLPPGATLTVDFSLLNLGTTTRDIVVYHYYLEFLPHPGARYLLLSGNAILTPDYPHELTKTVRLPTNVPPGDYAIVLVVDPGSAITERNETNNQAVWNRVVRVQ